MTTAYTSLLGLALPVDGELTGTWGQTVNNYITTYLDGAVAGTQIISGSLTAVTLSKTTGTSLSQAGAGATGSSQYQIIRCTGNPASLLTITAPAADKTYVVINATSTSQSVKIVGVGPTTGVTILSGKTSIVAWNGSDFVEITPSTISGTLPVANGGTGVTTSTGSGSVVLNTSPSLITPVLGTPTSGNFSSGTFTWPTFNQNTTGYASALKSASTTVSVSASTAPTTGQVLTATSDSAATWQTPSTSGGTVTSVSGTGTVSGLTLSGTVTSSGSLTLGGSITGFLPTTGGTMTGAITFASGQTVDGVNPIGYKNIPQTGSDKTTAYTLVTGDVGKYVGVGTSGSIVVPTSTFANGDAISIYNNTTGNITITTSAPTAYIGGTNTVKTSITLATRGIATILFVSATVCVVTGNVS